MGEVKDKDGYSMPFVFRPAAEIKIARTLIVLHGHGVNKNYSKFKDDNWNVIVPLDLHGTDGLGSWWMGEGGGLQTYHLLQNLVKLLNKHFVFSSLYFWGSSMGGYGAIVHGIELGAFAIYSHIPQIKLKNTRYTDGINAKFDLPIFRSSDLPIFRSSDLPIFRSSDLPIFRSSGKMSQVSIRILRNLLLEEILLNHQFYFYHNPPKICNII